MSEPRTRASLPIDPLADAAWARIGAGLRARLDAGELSAVHARRTQTVGWLGGGALAAAAALLLWWALPVDPPPRQATAPGRVIARDQMRIAHAGDANIELQAHSALEVQGDEVSGYTVQLRSGSARFSVPPRDGRPPFQVVTADLQVEVIGTRFVVSASAPASVAVEEGTVRVHWAGKLYRVGAGQRWRLPEPARAEGAPSGPPADAPTHVDPQATVEADAEAESARPATRPTKPVRHRGRTLRHAGRQQRFETAASLEARRPARALRSYLQLAEGDDTWAANALFAAARLQLETGDAREARGLLRSYLRRFPQGPNVADARTLLQGQR